MRPPSPLRRAAALGPDRGCAGRDLAADAVGLLDALGVSAAHVVGFSKPDPRLFAHALEHTDARAESTLHIGDMYEADVCGARAAGVRPLLLDPYADWDRPDCSTLPDLLALHAALS